MNEGVGQMGTINDLAADERTARIILAIASVLEVVFALCDQGRKHSAFKN